MADVYRTNTVAERLRIANQMFEFARRMIQGQVRTANPAWTETEVVRETACRISNGFVQPKHFSV